MPTLGHLIPAIFLALNGCWNGAYPAPTGTQLVEPVPLSAVSPAGALPVPRPPALEPVILDDLIPFDDERIALTLAYRQMHEDPAIETVLISPSVVILHHTASGSYSATRAYFQSSHLGSDRPELLAAGRLNVSAHFVVEKDGTIHRLVPEDHFARHCIGLNHVSIGVENVGGGGWGPLTQAQVEADAVLVRWLVATRGITHLIGHQEYRSLEGTSLFIERNPDYRNRKPDPGVPFMEDVRARLVDLHLRGAVDVTPSVSPPEPSAVP